MFHLFLNNYNTYDWFMIIDDDSYLYINKLLNYLSFFDKNDCYMTGDFLNWVVQCDENNFTCDYNKWIGGGPGIVFSKKCIEKFLKLIEINCLEYENHDVWLHKLYMCSDKRIKRVDCPGFHQFNAISVINKYSKESNNIISVHLEHNMDLIYLFHI